MKLGLTIFLTDQTIDPVELAVEAEQRGYSSLWLPEHTHIPAIRSTPYPGGGELPIEYIRSFDPTVALAMCAQATTSLVLGTGVALAAQHEPVAYAKTWASLDHLSRGRTRFGVGYGWNVEEMETHGVEFGTRRAQVREHVLAMQALWHHDEAAFAGEFVNFEPSWSWPKPVQQPHIPLWIAGGGEQLTLNVAARYAKYTNFANSLDEFNHKSDILRGHCNDVGRDFEAITRSTNFNVVCAATEAEVQETLVSVRAHYAPFIGAAKADTLVENYVKNGGMVGTPEQLIEELRAWEHHGMTYAIIYFPQVATNTSGLELFAREVIPALA